MTTSPATAAASKPEVNADSPEGSSSDVDSNVKLRQISGTTVRSPPYRLHTYIYIL